MVGPRSVDKPLVLYGNGKLGKLAREIFHEINIPIIGIVDKTCAFPQNHPRDAMLAICVATEPYYQIIKPLQEAGWKDIVPVWDIVEAYPEVGLHNGWFAGDDTEEDNANEAYISKRLSDVRSRRHYNAFVEWHVSRLEFDVPIEILFDPLPSTLTDIRNRQKARMLFMDKKDSNHIMIHAEGKELETLQSDLLKMAVYRPKIDVACYHSRDGLWKIEKFLMDNLPDYQWTFRLTAYMGQGAYIYGTPKERL